MDLLVHGIPPSANEKNWQRELIIESLEDSRTRLIEQLNQTRNELNTIKASLGYQSMHFYASKIDRLFPDGTARGELRKTIGNSLRALAIRLSGEENGNS